MISPHSSIVSIIIYDFPLVLDKIQTSKLEPSQLNESIPRKSKCLKRQRALLPLQPRLHKVVGRHARSVEHIKHCAALAARNAFRAGGQVLEPRRFNDGGGPLGGGWMGGSAVISQAKCSGAFFFIMRVLEREQQPQCILPQPCLCASK